MLLELNPGPLAAQADARPLHHGSQFLLQIFLSRLQLEVILVFRSVRFTSFISLGCPDEVISYN